MRPRKNLVQKKRLELMLDDLREGIVIVEGKHDVEALARLKIRSISFAQFIGGNLGTKSFQTEKIFYVWMDIDKGGADKEEKVVEMLDMIDGNIKYDVVLGKRVLKMLGITSVEQAYGRVRQVMASNVE